MKDSLNERTREAQVGPFKKSYQKPVLKTYGPVKHLTQGQGSFGSDGGSGRPGKR